jgi:transcriptional repressor NrdR
MRCPFCDINDDKVIDSREVDAGSAVRRRRECKRCGKRFTTYEHVEHTVKLTVIKRDGRRTAFDRDRVLLGLQKACHKRPVSADAINEAVEQIEDALMRRGQREVASELIGQLCIEQLKKLDHVALMRFASVYLKLSNVDELLNELQSFKDTTEPPPAKGQQPLFDGK